MKETLMCPVCSKKAILTTNIFESFYICPNCNWESTNTDTLDISYKSNSSAPLSNLFPHKFIIDGILCLSMESFIQSLRVDNKEMQQAICSNYSGMMAYKLRLSLNDWRKEGYIYWNGKRIKRNSKDYTKLITKAYDCLFEQNIVFREILRSKKDYYLIHSMGCDNIDETLLTEEEYRFQLNRLKEKF